MLALALVLVLSVAVAVAAPVRAPDAGGLDVAGLARRVSVIADAAKPARLGVAVYDFTSRARWSSQGGEALPLQSVFKVFAGARLLQEVDAGRRTLGEPVAITAKDLSVYWSPIAQEWQAPSRTYPVGELVDAAVAASDNTAGDLVMRLAGGPGALCAMFTKAGITGIRVDRYEREIQPELAALPPFGVDAVIDIAGFTALVDSVPPTARKKALADYLADPRDTATADGAVDFLVALHDGKLLSPQLTTALLRIMTNTRTGAHRLRAGLPKDALIAHKTGTGRVVLGVTPAVNDIGIVTLASGRQFAIAVMLAGSTSGEDAAEKIQADIAAAVVAALR